MKNKIKRIFRLLKALATDPRIPRPVRWLIGVSLAIKAVPFPDFGIDEVGLLIAFVLLSTIYRQTFNEIRAEIRQQEVLNQQDPGNNELDDPTDVGAQSIASTDASIALPVLADEE